MALTVTKTGPYFAGSGGATPNNQTQVKFSQLRNTFRLNNPTGSISASELLRDIDTNSTDPIVPDATENSAIASNPINTASDWEVSQFFGAIKFFDVEQDASDVNTNFNISSLTEFNNNLGKTIKKKFTLRGEHRSTNTSIAAAQILSPAWNLTMEIHGNFYGAGGGGGVENDVSGKPGGDALSINSGRVYVDIQPSGKVWGGGGGGEFGADGTSGAAGTCQKDTQITSCGAPLPACPTGFTLISSSGTGCCKLARWCSWGFCHNTCVASGKKGTCRATNASVAPPTVKGGNGATGRGYNNLLGSLTGSDGVTGVCPTCPDSTFTLIPGTGTCSGDGEDGGNGGDWGQNGGNTGASGNGGQGGSAISGSGFTVVGNNTNTVKGAI